MDNSDMTFDNKRIAMLIDGENAQSSLIDKMVAEPANTGWLLCAAFTATGPPRK